MTPQELRVSLALAGIFGLRMLGLFVILPMIILGRVIQGVGAISAAVIALLADLTREEVRTKAMAIMGISIGLTFALSMIGRPILNRWIGVPGIFLLTVATFRRCCRVRVLRPAGHRMAPGRSAGMAVPAVRSYPLPSMASAGTDRLLGQIKTLPGVRDATLAPDANRALLRVDMTRFDEQNVTRLLQGET